MSTGCPARSFESLEKEYDGETVTGWWARSNGSPVVLERFIRPFCRSIQFTEPEDFSAFNFLGWMHHVTRHPSETHLAGYQGARKRHDLYAAQALSRAQGRQGPPTDEIGRIEMNDAGDSVRAFQSEGGAIDAHVFVSALPVWLLGKVLPEVARRQPHFEAPLSLPTCPAISVQLWLIGP